MLRYFYLISLFICICALAYEYRGNHQRNSNRNGRKNVRVKKSYVGLKKNLDSSYDKGRKGSVQLFDVASFVQGSEEAIDDAEPYGYGLKKGSFTNNDDYDIGTSNDITEKKAKSQDYLNTGADNPHVNSPIYKDAYKPRRLTVNGLLSDGINKGKLGRNKIRNAYKEFTASNSSVNHNLKKKCSLKNMKFPFFSHNKTQTLKPKKNKKRKLFCLNCHNKNNKGTVEDSRRMDNTNISLKVKRAWKNLSQCKKPGANGELKDNAQKKNPEMVVHNSRQFYEHLDKMLHNPKHLKVDDADAQDFKNRYKREEVDRDRQLKELEEVQKKIDAIEIRVPNFEKKPPELTQEASES